MPILAISTVAETIVAVHHNDTVTFRVNTERKQQAEYLVPLVQEVMAEAGVGFPYLKRVGVVTGPGSFTGLRVGIATARGFGMGMDIPCVGIDSFTLWAGAARASGLTAPLAVMLDTLRDDVFAASYDAAGRYSRALLDPQVMTAAAAGKLLDENPYLTLVGNAYVQMPTRSFVPVTHTAMAHALIDAVARADAETAPAVPMYLREPDVTLPAAPTLHAH